MEKAIDKKESPYRDFNKYELDLGTTLTILWHKIIVIVAIIITLMALSLYVIISETPKYKATAFIVEPPQPSSNSGNFDSTNSIISQFIGLPEKQGNDYTFIFRAHEYLKTLLLDETKFNYNKFREVCPIYSAPSGISLGSVALFFGISELKNPTKEQQLEMDLECLTKLLSVEPDEFNGNRTRAIKIMAETTDPVFSANLANLAVEKYLLWVDKITEENFQKTRNYLAKNISKTQSDLGQAMKKLNTFVFEAAKSTFISKPSSLSPQNLDAFLNVATPFTMELQSRTALLSQNERLLNEHIEILEEMDEIDLQNYELALLFASSTGKQALLSNSFISELSGLQSKNFKKGDLENRLNLLFQKEKLKLKNQANSLRVKTQETQISVSQLVDKENEYRKLSLEATKNFMILEGLKDQLNTKIFEEGLALLNEIQLLSKAIPPLRPSSPNKRIILLLGTTLGLILGVAFVLFTEIRKKTIYKVSQLREIPQIFNKYNIATKIIGFRRSNYSQGFDSEILSNISGSGRTVCVIGLSDKEEKTNFAKKFVEDYVLTLVKKKSKNVLVLNSSEKDFFETYSHENKNSKEPMQDNSTAASVVMQENIERVNDQELLSGRNLSAILNKYKGYEKILVAVDTSASRLVQHNMVEECDFFMYVARAGRLSLSTVMNYFPFSKKDEKKFLGFFLLN